MLIRVIAQKAAIAVLAALSLCVTSALAADSVTLRLDWSVEGYHLPFYLGLEEGYYKDAGIDLTIEPGKGSALTVQLVGRGSDTFGFADGTAAARAIATGVPVKVVMGIVKRTLMAVLVNRDSNIMTPADLKGKTISVSPGDANGMLLPAFMKANNLPQGSINVVSVDPSAKYRLLGVGKVDGVAAYGAVSVITMRRLGVEVRKFDYADAGISIPAFGIVASQDTITKNPDLVRRFVGATAKAWQKAKQDHEAAYRAGEKRIEHVKQQEETYRQKLAAVMDYLDTPNTKGKPFGWMSEVDWKIAEQFLVEYMGAKPQASLAAYYTNEFVGK